MQELITVSRVESLSIACERWTIDQIMRKSEGSFSHPVQREHLHKGFCRLCCGKPNAQNLGYCPQEGRTASPDASIAAEIKGESLGSV